MMQDKIKGLEKQNRHLMEVGRRQRALLKDADDAVEAVRLVLDAHLVAAAITCGEKENDGYILSFPKELVTDGLYMYTVSAGVSEDGTAWKIFVRPKENKEG